MFTFAQAGFFTKLLELAATSIGAGIVVGGFAAACVGMRAGLLAQGDGWESTERCILGRSFGNVMSEHRSTDGSRPLVVITRNFYVTLALAACVLLVGGFLFRDSEAGSFLTLVVAFVGGLSLLHVLDDREQRRNEERTSRSSDR